MRRVLLIAFLLLAAAPMLAGALTINDVARDVRCPTCNTPLDVSSAPAAEGMREYIAARIDQGWDKQRIIDSLVEDFGPAVLATPPKSGFNLVAWLVPALLVGLGLAAIPVLTRAWTRRRREELSGPAPLSPHDARRLDEELRRLGPP
jgi:cytochrome c-type biogenesis protein CcmH